MSRKKEEESPFRIESAKHPEGVLLGRACRLSGVFGKKVVTYANSDFTYFRNGETIAVYGANEADRCRNYLVPNILAEIQSRSSIIVADPSGELYRQTAESAKNAGYDTRHICMYAGCDAKEAAEVAAVTDFYLTGWRPCAFFLSGSENVIAEGISYAYDMLDYDAMLHRDGKLTVPVHIFVDDFGLLPRISKILENWLNASSSENIRTSLCFDSVKQVSAVYGENADSILAACRIHLYFGNLDSPLPDVLKGCYGKPGLEKTKAVQKARRKGTLLAVARNHAALAGRW